MSAVLGGRLLCALEKQEAKNNVRSFLFHGQVHCGLRQPKGFVAPSPAAGLIIELCALGKVPGLCKPISASGKWGQETLPLRLVRRTLGKTLGPVSCVQ